ncbi:MAG: DUF2849 domain-containing protein [Alphaproteobacteria bacterium]|nr:DUF2849 domain-containing protein [Alphaproteobacteria bacterium]
MPEVLTANRLADGEVVYLADGEAWVGDLSGARLAHTKDEAAALEAIGQNAVRQLKVVAPYLIAVEGAGGALSVKSARERIRAAGPTVRRDLGKQAGA